MSEPIIQTHELTKTYGQFTAVNHLDITVNKGEVVGLLGQNGSGKTTTFLMLMGLSLPTSGTATVAGYDVVQNSKAVRTVSGLLPDGAGYYEDLSAKQNLNYIGQLNDIPKLEREKRITEMLDVVGLTKVCDKKVEQFSRGMKQRLGIAEVLMKRPKVAFFDEPTIGLDPQGTKDIRDLLLKLNKEQGITIVLSSHLLHDVQQTCQKLLIIREGKLIAADTIENLSNTLLSREDLVIEFELTKTPAELLRELSTINGVTEVNQENHRLYVQMSSNLAREVSETITKHKSTILLMKPKEYSLEEIFLRYYEED
ncbi:MAG: ABC transporter ATP-binding protein [Candidatus Bathyarchaeota archaeon]|nr:ABC transporter ATP-binding protein [Candidatus Bathyarchaeota archaeon]